MYLKTKELASYFGYCKATMYRILKDMIESGYAFAVLTPTKKGDSFRADPDGVKMYLNGRRAGNG